MVDARKREQTSRFSYTNLYAGHTAENRVVRRRGHPRNRSRSFLRLGGTRIGLISDSPPVFLPWDAVGSSTRLVVNQRKRTPGDGRCSPGEAQPPYLS